MLLRLMSTWRGFCTSTIHLWSIAKEQKSQKHSLFVRCVCVCVCSTVLLECCCTSDMFFPFFLLYSDTSSVSSGTRTVLLLPQAAFTSGLGSVDGRESVVTCQQHPWTGEKGLFNVHQHKCFSNLISCWLHFLSGPYMQVFNSGMDRDLILSFTKEMFDLKQFEQVSISRTCGLQEQLPTLLMLLCVSPVVLAQCTAVSGAALLHGGLCKPAAGSGAAGWSDCVQSSAPHWRLHGFWKVPISLHYQVRSR